MGVVKRSCWMRWVGRGDPECNTSRLSWPIWGGKGKSIVSACIQWICLHRKGVDEVASLAEVQAVQADEPVGGWDQFGQKRHLPPRSVDGATRGFHLPYMAIHM